jgi:hypothetical protein
MRLLESTETGYKLNKESKQTAHGKAHPLDSDNSINIVTATMKSWEKYKLVFLCLIIMEYNFK